MILKKKLKQFKPKSSKLIKSPKVLLACTGLAVIGTILIINSRAAGYCDIAPANDTLAVEAAINGCADGSTIRFPANASYSLNDTIFVKDRHNIVIDGQGSTFTITTDGLTKPSIQRLRPDMGNAYDCSKAGGNWMLLRGTNVTLKNMKAVGSFPPGLNGETRDIQKENRPEYLEEHKNVCSSNPNYAWIRYAEWMSNFGVYGTNGAHLQDLSGKAPWGDTVTTATDLYVDNYDHKFGGETRNENGATINAGNYAQNVTVKNVDSEEASRMCYGLTSGRNMTVEDSYCKSAWYGATDQEIDNVQQPLTSVYFFRNTFEGFHLFGYLLPVAGSNVRDIQIKDNVFTTPPDRQCNATIGMGGYPDVLTKINGVYIENNTMVSYGTAISLDSVANGTIKNNKITTLTGGNCGGADGSAAPIVKVSDRSAGIVQENNGPNAPGASTAGTSPTPTPEPSPAPTPTPPPSPSNCSAPTSFAGSPGPNGSGQYNFTWKTVTGGSQYSLWFGTPPQTAYAVGFTSNSATVYGLSPGQTYSFAVRTHCGSVVSPNSNVVTITLPTASAMPPPSPCTNKPASDTNCDGNVNALDVSTFRQRYKTNDPTADLNGDGVVNAVDISTFRNRYKSQS